MIVYRNIWSGATFIIDTRGPAGKEGEARMDALTSWRRS